GRGGVLCKVAGVAGVIDAVGSSDAAKAISNVAATEIESLAVVDTAMAAAKNSSLGRFLRRDVGTFLPGGLSPEAEVERLAAKAEELHAALPEKDRAWAGNRRTSATMSTDGGPDISGVGGRNWTESQRTWATARGG